MKKDSFIENHLEVISYGKGKPKRHKVELSVYEKHQLKIARSTLKMSEIGARIMGGPNHEEAKEIILRLTGKPAPA